MRADFLLIKQLGYVINLNLQMLAVVSQRCIFECSIYLCMYRYACSEPTTRPVTMAGHMAPVVQCERTAPHTQI